MQMRCPLTGVRRPASRSGNDGTLQKLKRRSPAACSAFRLAVETLWANKLRSSLTVLGIVIGIAAVVLVGAAIEALREYSVRTTAQAFGSNTFLISQVGSVGNLDRKQLADKLRKNPEIYRREAESLARAVSETIRMSPTLSTVADVKAGNRTFLAGMITGSSAALEDVRDIRISEGRFFTEEEARRGRGVVVLGQDIVNELFPGVDPLDREVRILGRPFTVIGIQETLGSSFGSSQDRYVWMPLVSYERIWGSRNSVTVFAQPRPGVDYSEAQEQARFMLRMLRALRPGQGDNFDVLVPESGRSFLGQLTAMISIAIVPISSVALFVAGIVVMNMMLVSVTERTREIGVRKSLGARRRDILGQILLESTLLAVAGGGLGLLSAVLGSAGLSRAFGTPVGVPGVYAALAVGLSAGVGLAAGVYPAYLASRLQPVEALRSET
jgi:putative ABC transport system permease protein